MLPEAYIVDAIRTPVGRKKGGLAAIHPADLGRRLDRGADGADGHRSQRSRRRRLRLRRHDRLSSRRYRAHLLARRRSARSRARHDRGTGNAARPSRPCISLPRP
ncbi:MAG: hypothetical protein WDN69_14265 [Aliidongia sp.]